MYCGQEEAGMHSSENWKCSEVTTIKIRDHFLFCFFLPPKKHFFLTVTESSQQTVLSLASQTRSFSLLRSCRYSSLPLPELSLISSSLSFSVRKDWHSCWGTHTSKQISIYYSLINKNQLTGARAISTVSRGEKDQEEEESHFHFSRITQKRPESETQKFYCL